jgi:hypothetical protein
MPIVDLHFPDAAARRFTAEIGNGLPGEQISDTLRSIWPDTV